MGGSLKLDKSQIHFSIDYGSEGLRHQKTTGRWPGGNQNSSYEMTPLTIKMNSSRDILSGFVSTEEDLYLREIHASIKIKARHKNPLHYSGTYPGSPGMTVLDDQNMIRFKRNKHMKQIISFNYKPALLTVKITWFFNCYLPAGTTLQMDPILITEKERGLQPPVRNPESVAAVKSAATAWIAPGEENRGVRYKTIEDNLSWMEKERLFFDMVRIDGLHPKIGDLDSIYTDFRGKIGFLNRRIEHNGMIPAIGFNPFQAESGSELVRLHPDWLVRDLRGDTILTRQSGQKKFHYLDFTLASVQQYLKESLELFYRQWGFKAFHIFEISSLLIPGHRYKNSLETGAVLRETLELFRHVLGNSCFISADDSPLITQEKLLSMICLRSRTGAGRKSKKLIPQAINRILDHTYTSHYPWKMNMGSYPLPKAAEPLHPQAGESLRQMMIINGGFLTVEDDLNSLTDIQKDELIKLLSSFRRFSGGSLHLINQPGKKDPCIVYNSAGYIGVFNLSGRKKQISLNMEDLKRSIYNKQGESLIKEGNTGMRTGELELILPPFGSRIFKF